jgi:hypothetical protein
MRVNFSLLGICFVDAWLLHSGARGCLRRMKQSEFYENLAQNLIENNYDSVGLRARYTSNDAVADIAAPVSGFGPHTTPTKRKKSTRDGMETSYKVQKRCKVCRQKTTKICSQCKDDEQIEYFVCDSNRGRNCFASHVFERHS